ncbi:ribosomal L7Ae/L30e/S12e/Gadd45 family protein [Fonticella tunisiensis]|uniref:Large subunit ribosomal protein L7A n=1 Tax=Fonticella tunisiensis TaxID=1096341 RepID=A0A4R7K7S2_9CLOT|nr:ribosomal L7Ae/L30e/S12e/Gadd45 family protein [Fonticella tunisiensis]TDT46024.1 large subunit ribosomal protein L7A [Fonticella tunisiensis]
MNIKLPEKRVVGAKQSLKAIKSGNAKIVYVADDADPKIINPIVEACQQTGVELVHIETMQRLGALCGIDVGAAAACVVND